jgi:hypothetical protein
VVFAAVSSGAQLAVRGGAQLAVRGGVWMVCKQRAKVPFKRVYLHHYLVLHACVQCSIVRGRNEFGWRIEIGWRNEIETIV